jgi:hypothetical protein
MLQTNFFPKSSFMLQIKNPDKSYVVKMVVCVISIPIELLHQQQCAMFLV